MNTEVSAQAGDKTEAATTAAVLPAGEQHAERGIIGSAWSGPLPSPAAFKEYPQDAQSAILHAFKEENENRHKRQEKYLDAKIAESKRKQRYPFVIALTAIFVSGALIFLGHNWGALIMTGVVAALPWRIGALFGAAHNGAESARKNEGE